MIYINKPDTKVTKFFHISDTFLTDETYKMTNYYYEVSTEHGLCLYNTLSKACVMLDNKEKDALENFEKFNEINAAVLEGLRREHFIVPRGWDEEKEYFQIYQSLRLFERVRKQGVTSYTILTTTACNARCFYCFESDFVTRTMTKGTADEVVNYIIKQSKGKVVTIRWFGGEPLCAYGIITYISEKLAHASVEFQSKMISNGSLFNEDLIREAISTWRLKSIQITFDGTEHEHNCRKNYVSFNGSPFKKTLENVKQLLNAGVRVLIRINMDRNNEQEVKELIDELVLYFDKDLKPEINIGLLFQEIHSPEVVEMLKHMSDMSDYVHFCGFENVMYKPDVSNHFGKFSTSVCLASNPDRCVVIDPDGNLCACDNHTEGPYYGNVKNGITDMEEWNRSMSPGLTRSECKDCPGLPRCTEVGASVCPQRATLCKDVDAYANEKEIREHVKVFFAEKT